MIKDITGIFLLPGNEGKDCKGNGNHVDDTGNIIPMCCDECDYLICCISEEIDCSECFNLNCPRKLK